MKFYMVQATLKTKLCEKKHSIHADSCVKYQQYSDFRQLLISDRNQITNIFS